MGDNKYFIQQAAGGFGGGSVFYNASHDSNGGEWQFNSSNSVSFNLGQNGQKTANFQLGTTGATYETVTLQYNGSADAINQIRTDKKLLMGTQWWNGSASVSGYMGMIVGTSTSEGLRTMYIDDNDPGFNTPAKNTGFAASIFTLNSNALHATSFIASSSIIASNFPLASTSLLTVSSKLYTPSLADGCAQITGGVLVSTGINCGTGGGGTGGGTWSTTTSQVVGQLINYSNNNTDIVAIGGSATTSAKFYFDPNTNRSLIPLASTTALTVGGSLYIPGSNGCLQLTGGLVNSTGVACGTGGSSFAYPFTPLTNFSVINSATTTPLWSTSWN